MIQLSNILNVCLGGFLFTMLVFVACKAMTINRKIAGDVYTHDRDKAKYGKHVGPVDDGLNNTIRRQVYDKYGRVCQITGRSGIPGDADTNGEHIKVGIGILVELQVGHIIPCDLGGPTVLWNLIPMEKKLNNRLKDKVTPMAESLCRRRGEMIWVRGIKKTTFEIEKRKLAQKRRLKFSLN